MLSAKDKITTFLVVIFLFIKKGFEQGGRKPKAFGRKQSGGLFLPTVATSTARRERRQPRKNPLLSAIKTKPSFWVVLFFYNEKGFEQGGRKAKPFGRKQSGGLFLPTVVTSKARRERQQPRKNPLLSVKNTTPTDGSIKKVLSSLR